MLGWDALNSEEPALFNFHEHDARTMRAQLLESMPKELFGLVSEEPDTVEANAGGRFANENSRSFSPILMTSFSGFSGKERFGFSGPMGNRVPVHCNDCGETIRLHCLKRCSSPEFPVFTENRAQYPAMFSEHGHGCTMPNLNATSGRPAVWVASVPRMRRGRWDRFA